MRYALALLLCSCVADPRPTCEEVVAESTIIEQVECGITGEGFVVAGVSYYDAETNMTWFQHVRSYHGELGVVGQVDQWVAGCYWFPCEMTKEY